MSYTTTLTLVSLRESNPIEPLQFQLEELPPEGEILTREIIRVALCKLSGIASRYARLVDAQNKPIYDDLLSQKLLVWSKQVLLDFNNDQKIDKEYIEDVATRIHELTHEILVNPMDRATLVDPILVDNELPLWERRVWIGFQTDLELPPQEGRIHDFALDVIAWRNDLPIAELNPTIDFSDPSLRPLQKLVGRIERVKIDEDHYERPRIGRTITYSGMHLGAVGKQNMELAQIRAQDNVENIRKLWKAAEEHNARHTAEFAARAKQHTEMLDRTMANMQASYNQSLSNMKTAYQEDLNNMKTRYENHARIMSQHINTLQAELQAEAARSAAHAQLAAQRAIQISSLSSSLSSVAAQDAANRQSLQRHRSRGCTIS